MSVPLALLLADSLLGGHRWYRRLRGGKWEHEGPCCVWPADMWRRVEVFHARAWPAVIGREDYRGRTLRSFRRTSAALGPGQKEGPGVDAPRPTSPRKGKRSDHGSTPDPANLTQPARRVHDSNAR